MRHWWAIGLLSLCVGCGFHLRGQEYSLKSHSGAWLLQSSPEVSSSQRQALQEALDAAGAMTHEDGDGLRIVLEKSTNYTEPLAFGIDGEVRRERIGATLTFRLENAQQVLLPPQVLSRSQERIRYANHDLSDATDKEKIIQDLEAALAHQIVLRLDLWLQSQAHA